MLGHNSIRTTQIYAKIVDFQRSEGMNNLPECLKEKQQTPDTQSLQKPEITRKDYFRLLQQVTLSHRQDYKKDIIQIIAKEKSG